MRTAGLMVAALALGIAAPAEAQSNTAAEIAAIEQAWGEAFMKRDRAYLESLLAPEFKLMRADGGQPQFTPRARWLDNFERYIFYDFQVRTIDVVESGDTAVATVTGRWKVGIQGREGTREEGFILSDTFVRRGGQWKVLYRHSSPHPLAPPPTVPAVTNERG